MRDNKKHQFRHDNRESQRQNAFAEQPKDAPEETTKIHELDPEDANVEDVSQSDEPENEREAQEAEILKLNEELQEEKKKYLFLMAEFDNFRKRTLKEKSEMIKNAGEQVLKGILPIIDDFERGLEASANATDVNGVREGMELIYNKFTKYLEQNGVKPIDPADKEFDTERHEAISAVPVEDEGQKGKILDTVQKGYTLNDKVLRHAKVVVGK